MERHLGEGVTDGGEGRLGPALTVRDAEGPVVYFGSSSVPFVGPREHENAGTAAGEGRADLPIETACLRELAVTKSVEPDFTENHRAVCGDVLQPRQVRFKSRLFLEVHVVTNEIEEWELKVFRRGVVHIGDQSLGVLVLDRRIELLQIALDPPVTVPTRDLRRDLVAERVGQKRRMPDALTYSVAHHTIVVHISAPV